MTRWKLLRATVVHVGDINEPRNTLFTRFSQTHLTGQHRGVSHHRGVGVSSVPDGPFQAHCSVHAVR